MSSNTEIATKPSAEEINGNNNNKTSTQYRWAAEFMAGPGGYLQRAEVVSDWFQNIDEAKEDALTNAEDYVNEYPFSRGRILKLLVESKTGNIVELSNVQNLPAR